MKNRILPVFIPFYGCRQRCIYCDQNSITGQTNQNIFDSAEQQIEDYLKISHDWTELAFYGGSFTCLPLETQQKLYDTAHHYGFKKLRFSTSPDCVNDGNMILAEKNGVESVEIGIQSLDDEVLKANNRPCGRDETIKSVLTAKKYIKSTAMQIMTGMYKENFRSFSDTVDEVIRLKPEYVRIYPCVVLGGTELFRLYESGDFVPVSPEESIARTAYGYILLEAAGINVIRTGLQDTEQMKDTIRAGFYHPATGDIVKTIAVAIYLRLGHNLEIDKKYINTAYGYNGYNRDACKDRIVIKDGASISFNEICRKITESGLENYKRIIQRETARIAEGLVGSPDNR